MAHDRQGEPVNKLTVAELELRRAQLTERAEKLRARQRATVPTTPTASALARDIRETQGRADDYAALLAMLATPDRVCTIHLPEEHCEQADQ